MIERASVNVILCVQSKTRLDICNEVTEGIAI